MIRARWVAVLVAGVAAGMALACGGSQRVRTPTSGGSSQDQIVLLPDGEGGAVGRASVQSATAAGSAADLATARASTLVSANRPPSPPTELSAAEVSRLFGDVLSTLPPAPRHFTLYFRFESDELTDESRALVAQILQAVKDRPAPDVVVVGHTDTTGTPAANSVLGLRRANTVRALLVAAGLDAAFIAVGSHGEADLLIPTANEVFEPRNRRVEITVR
jgi:outer membrane protein OmpA-like peptidoglycan-associated protein